MSIEECPVCGEKLWADGATPDGKIFIGMATAGYCPKCGKFYYWSTGNPVPDRYSKPSRISVSVEGRKPLAVTEKASRDITLIELMFIVVGTIVASPLMLFAFFVTWAIEKSKDIFGFKALLFEPDEYSAFKSMTWLSIALMAGSAIAFIFIRSNALKGVTLWYGFGTLVGLLLLIFGKSFVRRTG